DTLPTSLRTSGRLSGKEFPDLLAHRIGTLEIGEVAAGRQQDGGDETTPHSPVFHMPRAHFQLPSALRFSRKRPPPDRLFLAARRLHVRPREVAPLERPAVGDLDILDLRNVAQDPEPRMGRLVALVGRTDRLLAHEMCFGASVTLAWLSKRSTSVLHRGLAVAEASTRRHHRALDVDRFGEHQMALPR